jgi:hypothetical protein
MVRVYIDLKKEKGIKKKVMMKFVSKLKNAKKWMERLTRNKMQAKVSFKFRMSSLEEVRGKLMNLNPIDSKSD